MHSKFPLSRRRVRRDLTAKVIALVAMQVLGAAARGDELVACRALPRPQDELWLVSSRSLGCGDPKRQVGSLQYWRYDRERCWTKANLTELSAHDEPNGITTIFVHGNRISSEEAFTKGWNAYGALVRGADERPVRFVIWSWPSETIRGPINDARVKAYRTDPAAFYLGWFVDQLSPETPVSFWGHSFGARIVTGALHLLGGGAIAGNRLNERKHSSRRPMQVVVAAAALDDDWLLPGHCHGSALSQVDSMLSVHNCCDALLKRYHVIYADRGHEQALGYRGINASCLPAGDAAKLTQIDACCQVGKHHLFDGYLASPYLLARMRPFLLFAPNETQLSSQPAAAGKGD